MISRPTNLGAKYYFTPLINKLEGVDLISTFERVKTETIDLIDSIPKEKYDHAYADGKWTIKEIFQHNIDCERILAYRALRMARMDNSKMAGFDENDYVTNSFTNNLKMNDIASDFKIVRDSSISLFNSFQNEALNFEGNANGMTITPLIIGWFIAAHNHHHNQMIKERYL